MFRNLEAEMARSSISSETIATTIGRSYNTTRLKINGKQPFTFDEVLEIKRKLFPNLSIEYLFEKSKD